MSQMLPPGQSIYLSDYHRFRRWRSLVKLKASRFESKAYYTLLSPRHPCFQSHMTVDSGLLLLALMGDIVCDNGVIVTEEFY